MSLAALNAPPLVVAAGAGQFLLLSIVQKAIEGGAFSWTVLKAANICAYAVNFMAVKAPGRIDGSQPQKDGEATKKRSRSKEMVLLSTGRQGRTLVAPSGWAFIIWAPIFLGELVSVMAQAFVPSTTTIQPVLQKLTGPFVIANAFQSLWTAAFRPKYTGALKFISPAMLGGTAYCLSKAHATVAASQLGLGHYMLYGLPITLHFGWVTAASIVNLNGAVATCSESVSAQTVAAFGHVSVVAAATLGAIVTIVRGAPIYGGVISWALWAVADGMTKRIESTKDEDPKRVGVYGCRLQRQLSRLGAIVSGGASLYAMVAMFGGKEKAS